MYERHAYCEIENLVKQLQYKQLRLFYEKTCILQVNLLDTSTDIIERSSYAGSRVYERNTYCEITYCLAVKIRASPGMGGIEYPSPYVLPRVVKGDQKGRHGVTCSVR